MGGPAATPRSTRFQTIRFRLAAALAIALLPVLVLSVWQASTAYRIEAEDRRADLVLGAERSAATARARLESAVVLLETLRPESVGLACSPRLQFLSERLGGYEALVRYTASGRVVCASGTTPFGLAGTQAPWFDELRRGERMVIARAPPGAFSDQPAVLAAVRAERPLGRFDGAFVAVIPLESLRPRRSDRSFPAGTQVALADGSGALLTATAPGAFERENRAWVDAVRAGGSRLFEARGPDGERRIYAAAPLVGQDVFVILASPAPSVWSWARLNPLASLVLPLIGWILAVGAVMVVTERVVVRWLAYLERIAALYAKGRFQVRTVQARNAPVEIRALAATMDQMADAIEARDLELHQSLDQKDALMREIHHRVKNNLQVISSLLNMQQRALSDPAARAAMSDTRQRITALSLIYRALYQSPDIKRVDVRQFLEELIASLISADSGRGPLVRTELAADTLVIDPDKLAPLALWAVEAISNAQKHAFVDRGGTLSVRFTVGDGESTLEVQDDGPGADETRMGQGVGRTLMTAFARQLRGTAQVTAAPEGGLIARLVFPTPEAPRAAQPKPARQKQRGNPVAA